MMFLSVMKTNENSQLVISSTNFPFSPSLYVCVCVCERERERERDRETERGEIQAEESVL